MLSPQVAVVGQEDEHGFVGLSELSNPIHDRADASIDGLQRSELLGGPGVVILLDDGEHERIGDPIGFVGKVHLAVCAIAVDVSAELQLVAWSRRARFVGSESAKKKEER